MTSRLAIGWTPAQAREQILAIEQQIAKDYPDSHSNTTINFTDLREALYGSYRPALLLLSAAVGALLLIACTNVANLTLTRVSDRRAEFAMRASLVDAGDSFGLSGRPAGGCSRSNRSSSCGLMVGVVAAAALAAGLVPAIRAGAPQATSVLTESSSGQIGSYRDLEQTEPRRRTVCGCGGGWTLRVRARRDTDAREASGARVPIEAIRMD